MTENRVTFLVRAPGYAISNIQFIGRPCAVVRFPSKSTYLEFFFGFSQPDGYNCGCGQGYTCQRYGSNYYWGKCVASCSSDSSCKKTECCSGRRCKPQKGAGNYCPRKGVINCFFLIKALYSFFKDMNLPSVCVGRGSLVLSPTLSL